MTHPFDAAVHAACREVIAAYRLGRRISRSVPISVAAQALQVAADEAAGLLPVESQHLGAVWEGRWMR